MYNDNQVTTKTKIGILLGTFIVTGVITCIILSLM